MAVNCIADGSAMVTESIFENRGMPVNGVLRLSAGNALDRDSAEIRGVEKLTGAPVMATDLRASVSLVIAALAAEGDTVLHRVYHLDRGFESLEQKLQDCGADIERLAGQ
jgi:UDP-N-acetylglucosamine 1-carboxyvinyltransferase